MGEVVTETCTHAHAHMHTCARVYTQYSCTTWAAGWGRLLQRHAHMCVCAHTMLMYKHSYRHMAMDTQYTSVHTNLQRLRRRPVVSRPLQD